MRKGLAKKRSVNEVIVSHNECEGRTMSSRHNVPKTSPTRRFPAAIAIRWVHASRLFLFNFIYFFFIFIAGFCTLFSPSVDSQWATFFLTLSASMNVCRNKKKSRNTQFFEGNCFRLDSFFSGSIVAAVFAVCLFCERIICQCCDCVHINIVRLVGNHALFRSLSVVLVFVAYAKKYFDMLQIYCSTNSVRFGIISCKCCCASSDAVSLCRPKVALTWSCAAIKYPISLNGDAKLKTTQNEIKMVNGTCTCLLPVSTHHPVFESSSRQTVEKKRAPQMKYKHGAYSIRLGQNVCQKMKLNRFQRKLNYAISTRKWARPHTKMNWQSVFIRNISRNILRCTRYGQ